MASPSRFKPVYGSAGTVLDTTVTKSDPSLPIVRSIEEFREGPWCRTTVTLNPLTYSIAADAAEGFGQHIYTFPEGYIWPLAGRIKMSTTCATGLSATAGEVALGHVVATGAIATMGAGAATMESIMEGTTISNHVAATQLVTDKANTGMSFDTHGATAVSVQDGTSTAKKVYFNICSTWNQTAAENITFDSVVCTFDWYFLGDA